MAACGNSLSSSSNHNTDFHNTPCQALFSKSEEDGGPLHTSFGRMALLPLSSPEVKLPSQKSPGQASLRSEKCFSAGSKLGSGSANLLSYHPSDTSTSSDGDQVTSIIMDEVEPLDIVLTRTEATENLKRYIKHGRLQVPSVPCSHHRGKAEGRDGKVQAAGFRQASFNKCLSHLVKPEPPVASSSGQQVKGYHHSKHCRTPGSPRWSKDLKERVPECRKTPLT